MRLPKLVYLLLAERLGEWRHRSRLRELLELLSPKQTDIILEVGAGTGWIADAVANECEEVFALEPDADRVEYARKRHPRVKAFTASAESIGFPGAYFGKAYAAMALRHFADPDQSVGEIERVLKPDGLLVANELKTTRHRAHSNSPKSRRGELSFFAPAELRALLENHGFEIEKVVEHSDSYFLVARKIRPE